MLDILKGFRVIEHGTYITGPCASMILGDLGADVIKVELPGVGDPFRAYNGELYSPHYQTFGRNKRSVTLDVRQRDDRQAFDELIGSADVYIQNFRPGFAEKLGIGPDDLHAINPGLIYCSISGFGSSGPYRNRPCFDGVAQAMRGFLRLMVDEEKPRVMGPAIGDTMTGTYAALAIVAALLKRGADGPGDRLEISMLESMAYFNIDDFTHYFSAGELMGPRSRPSVSQAHVLRCSDGELICIHLSAPVKFWESLVEVIDRPDLLLDPRFRERTDRTHNADVLAGILEGIFARHPREYWVARLDDAAVPFSPVYKPAEVAADPQAQWMDLFVASERPDGSPAPTVRFPVTFGGKRTTSVRRPPLLGEHNAEILGRPDLAPETPVIGEMS